jgi:hypothetical protein
MKIAGTLPLALAMALGSHQAHADEADLPALLRGGGLIIALVAAGHGPGSAEPQPPPGCREGTGLTRAGWQDALAIGVGLRKQRVFVELAYAGPGCAARHTAYLAFGADRVRHDPGLATTCSADVETRRERRAALQARLTMQPPYPRTNLAVVVDACNLRDLARPGWPACAHEPGAGGALLFDPARETTLVGCLDLATLRAWSRLPE